MSDTIQATLVALKDVQGVQGSFVLGNEGALVAMEMPPLFDESMFAELGPRIERLSDSFASLGDELDSCMVRFSDHVLCIKKFPKGGALCILTSHTVNLPALRMAMNLAHRRLALATRQDEPSPPNARSAAPPVAPAGPGQPPSPPAAPAPDPAPASREPERKVPRYYRGQLVED